MTTLQLTTEEVHLVREALHAFLDDFGHDEVDVVRRVKDLIAKLPADPGPAPE